MKKEFQFDYGRGKISFSVASRNILSEIKANEVTHQNTGLDEVKRALANPIGTLKLSEIVSKGESVCIVTSDMTRPCPSYILLPPMIEELMEAGVSVDDITVVFALGSHRRHTVDEMRELVGDYIYELVHTVDSDPEDTVFLGNSSRGTPINITSVVAQSDRRICLGNIEMHYFAGYSGGSKAIMPGVSDRVTIQANHSKMVEATSVAGKIPGNNVRLDIEEAADFCGIDFILNVVLDEDKEIVKAVAGDRIMAHRAGCEFLDSMYKIKIPQLADIVIATPGGYPKDINIYQAQKALDNAKYAVKPGGIIILAADCSDGFGERVFEEWLTEAKSSAELITRIKNEFRLGGHKAAAIAMVLEKCEVFFVSNLKEEIAAKTFMKPYDNLQKAVDDAIQKIGINAKIIIMPHAGATLPYLS